MSAWKDEPDEDGLYWIRLYESDPEPTIVKVENGRVWQLGCDSPLSISDYNRDSQKGFWQWQKVKPYEQ